MITFLVSIFSFHIYNFVINKDNLSGKITEIELDKFKNIEALITKIETAIASFLAKVTGEDFFLKKHKEYPWGNSEKLNYDKSSLAISLAEKQITAHNTKCDELKKNFSSAKATSNIELTEGQKKLPNI